MKFSLAAVALAATTPIANALNILISNDDGFTSSNIRATYQALKTAGHNVYLIASTTNMSGHGGQFDFSTDPKLTADTEFGDFKAGSPVIGHEESDNHIWYFNGTPAACVGVGLDYVIPRFFSNATIDLVVAGPNEGANAGNALYQLSGTIGAANFAIDRGYPAIAFSAQYDNHSYYKDGWLPNKDNKQYYSNIYADKVVELVATLEQSAGENPQLLPLGVGLNVNFPYVGDVAESTYNMTCTNPEYVFTRMSPAGIAWSCFFNETTGAFDWLDLTPNDLQGANMPYNGDLTLPGETVISGPQTCKSSISVFTVDYDAPLLVNNKVHSLLTPVLKG